MTDFYSFELLTRKNEKTPINKIIINIYPVIKEEHQIKS